ncbi:MAG TPA: PIN domain-containing protein, partial [Pseudorhodoferax sp.]|nr:PIN domain-containing protein [Pseudorhodoferax sp.]
MPLPPPPAKRAATLSPDAFDAPARASSKPARVARSRFAEAGAEDPTPAAREAQDEAPAAVLREVVTAEAPVVLRDDAPSAPARQRRTAATDSAAAPARKRKPAKASGPSKLFVLDTNVLMHDPMCLFRFEEHDIYLPMIVLEELDGHKKGMSEVARNARQSSRTLDALAGAPNADIAVGLPLATTGHREAGGKLFFQTRALDDKLPASLPQGKADNQILGVVEALRREQAPREVVLVSKDINMRVKAKALGLAAEDYQNDKTLEDGEFLYSGALALPPDFWAKHGKTVESWQQGQHTFYRIAGPIVPSLHINQFVYFEAPGEPSLYARVTEIRAKTAVLKTLKDFNHLK